MFEVQEELQLQIDQLVFRVEEQNKKHAEAIAALQTEAAQIKEGLLATLEKGWAQDEAQLRLGDDALRRRVVWRIENFSEVKEIPTTEAIWSEEFSVMGVPGFQLEFFPQGREATIIPGFCGFFVWCPGGVKLRYQLFVGKHWCAPQEDIFEHWMGHGHSNFCQIEAHKDEGSDSITVGLEILSLHRWSNELGVTVHNEGPEGILGRELAVLHNANLNFVEWRIKNIADRIRDFPVGTALCSPLFSIAGVREMLLEFYPNGMKPPPGSRKEWRPGYCGLFVRASNGRSRGGGPLTLQLTLCVGGAKKGPILAEFDGESAKGLPQFCQIQEQLDGEDLLVGLEVTNPSLLQEEAKGDLYL